MKTNKTMTTETKIVAAAVLGTIAFKAGLKAVPALDKNLEPLLAGNKVGEGIPVLKAWLKSWHAANLAKVISDPTHQRNEKLYHVTGLKYVTIPE